MLLLIAGITGDLGQRIAREALARDVTVRGLARTPSKLAPNIADRLESFVASTSYGDLPALDKAVAGVDAVICAYSTDPILYLDGNLALLRAAERAGVKVFFASSWTNDWTNIQRGDFPIYDPLMSFRDQAELTSEIKPVFIINGTFAEYTLQAPAEGTLRKTYWGQGGGDFPRPWTAMDDAAAYTVDILLHAEGVREGKGGIFRIQSGQHSLRELADIFRKTTGRDVELVQDGELEDAQKRLQEARAKDPRNFWGYVREASDLVAGKGLWVYNKPVYRLDHLKHTTFEEHLIERYGLKKPAA